MKETENKTVELTDEELENVSGGDRDYRGCPRGYTWCGEACLSPWCEHLEPDNLLYYCSRYIPGNTDPGNDYNFS